MPSQNLQLCKGCWGDLTKVNAVVPWGGGRRQEPGARSQEAGGRRQEAGGRSQEPGGRRQESGVPLLRKFLGRKIPPVGAQSPAPLPGIKILRYFCGQNCPKVGVRIHGSALTERRSPRRCPAVMESCSVGMLELWPQVT